MNEKLSNEEKTDLEKKFKDLINSLSTEELLRCFEMMSRTLGQSFKEETKK